MTRFVIWVLCAVVIFPATSTGAIGKASRGDFLARPSQQKSGATYKVYVQEDIYCTGTEKPIGIAVDSNRSLTISGTCGRINPKSLDLEDSKQYNFECFPVVYKIQGQLREVTVRLTVVGGANIPLSFKTGLYCKELGNRRR